MNESDTESMNDVLRPIATYRAKPAVFSLVYDQSHRRLISGGTDGITVWKLSAEGPKAILETPDDTIYSLAVSKDGSLLVSGGKTTHCCVWGVQNKTCKRIDLGIDEFVSAAQLINDDRQLVLVTSRTGTIVVWGMESHAEHVRKVTGVRSPSIGINHDGTFAALADISGNVEVWNLRSTKREFHLNVGKRNAIVVALHPGGNTFAVAGIDGAVRVISEQGKIEQTIGGVEQQPMAMTFSLDGTLLAVASGNSTKEPGAISIFEVATGRRVRLNTAECHNSTVRALSFAPDGKKLVSGALDGSVGLWDVGDAFREQAID